MSILNVGRGRKTACHFLFSVFSHVHMLLYSKSLRFDMAFLGLSPWRGLSPWIVTTGGGRGAMQLIMILDKVLGGISILRGECGERGGGWSSLNIFDLLIATPNLSDY
jgi:hypothetical protein